MGQYSESFSSHFYEERRKCIKFDIQGIRKGAYGLSSLPPPHIPPHPYTPTFLLKLMNMNTSVIFPFSIWCAPSKASFFYFINAKLLTKIIYGSVTYWFYLPNSHSYLPVPHIYYYPPIYFRSISAEWFGQGSRQKPHPRANCAGSGQVHGAGKIPHLIPATHCITADSTRLHARVWKTNKQTKTKQQQQ